MEFSWSIFAMVVIGNVAAMGAIVLAQAMDTSLPPRNSLIPGTLQKFLYTWGFWTMTYGDFFAIPLIVNAFVHMALQDTSNLWWFLPISVFSALAFWKMCLGKDHKPDYGFPDVGETSTAGYLHLLYFGAGMGAAVISIWGLIDGSLRGPVMWTALVGGAIYVTCFILEIKCGNFDPLKRVEANGFVDPKDLG